MTYYDTLAEDLRRVREILAEGRMADEEFEQLYAGWPDELREHVREFFSGGTIYGKDIYAAYKLLESLANEVELLQQQVRNIQNARTVFGDVKGRDLDLILGPNNETSITCPTCKRTSYNRNDVRHRYCGFCHKFLGDRP